MINNKHKIKVAGANIVDSSNRHNSDQGGRNPLTNFPLVPVGCVMPQKLILSLRQRSDYFINPTNFRPYGITALCRVICQIMVERVDKYSEDDILQYLKSREVGISGRASIGDETKKVPLLIVKSTVERINECVIFFNNSLIGTSSIVRFLLEKGLSRISIEELYAFAPPKHLSFIVTKRLTIDDLHRRFILEKKHKS